MDREQIRERMRQLNVEFRAELPARWVEIATAWERFRSAPDDLAGRDLLRLHVHRLSGSAASFGQAEIGRHAQRVEAALEQLPQAPADGVAALETLLATLEDSCANPVMSDG